MSKYIKVEDIKDAFAENIIVSSRETVEEIVRVISAIKHRIIDLPTIDIVRCKDCKHNPKRTNDLAYGRCVCCCEDDWYGYVPDDDFFCGRGERIEK